MKTQLHSAPICLRVTALASAFLVAGCAEFAPVLDQMLGAVPSASQSVDTGTVAAGLRDALRVGSENASARVSLPDGYAGNPRLRIPLPDELESVGNGLRRIGFGGEVDRFETSMNRAAETAAGEAVDVFGNAVAQLTIDDAMGILRGPDDAATQYLRRTSGAELESRFRPIIADKMREVGAVQLYGDLMNRVSALPLVPKPEMDLEGYVTGKAIDGLFLEVADEEQRIRTDPAARVTDLLQTVFGSPR